MKVIGYGICGPGEAGRYMKDTLDEFKRLCDAVIILCNNVDQAEIDLIKEYGFEFRRDRREWGAHQWQIKQDFIQRDIQQLANEGDMLVSSLIYGMTSNTSSSNHASGTSGSGAGMGRLRSSRSRCIVDWRHSGRTTTIGTRRSCSFIADSWIEKTGSARSNATTSMIRMPYTLTEGTMIC